MRAKAILLVSVALVAVFALSSWAKAQSASGQPASGQPRLITVTGDADVRVVPDEVILTLGVETWDKNMDIAKRQNDEIVTKVLALATDHGIAPEHIQTDYISIEPRYRNDGYYEQRDFIGFFVHKTVVLTLRDLSSFEAVLSGALNAGVNYVHGIEFRTTELRKHRDEARALAIQAAQEKATALAGELGQKVGNPGGAKWLVVGIQCLVGLPLRRRYGSERDPGSGRGRFTRRWQRSPRSDQGKLPGHGQL
jgi:uncharacterized protein YggE